VRLFDGCADAPHDLSAISGHRMSLPLAAQRPNILAADTRRFPCEAAGVSPVFCTGILEVPSSGLCFSILAGGFIQF
jgi:hypothetical protein